MPIGKRMPDEEFVEHWRASRTLKELCERTGYARSSIAVKLDAMRWRGQITAKQWEPDEAPAPITQRTTFFCGEVAEAFAARWRTYATYAEARAAEPEGFLWRAYWCREHGDPLPLLPGEPTCRDDWEKQCRRNSL